MKGIFFCIYCGTASHSENLKHMLHFLFLDDFPCRLFAIAFTLDSYPFLLQLHQLFICQLLVMECRKLFNVTFINSHKLSLLSQSHYCHIYGWFEDFKIIYRFGTQFPPYAMSH